MTCSSENRTFSKASNCYLKFVVHWSTFVEQYLNVYLPSFLRPFSSLRNWIGRRHLTRSFSWRKTGSALLSTPSSFNTSSRDVRVWADRPGRCVEIASSMSSRFMFFKIGESDRQIDYSNVQSSINGALFILTVGALRVPPLRRTIPIYWVISIN